jgi:hypothetical protein
MQVTRTFVPIAPSGPSLRNPCRYPHAEKNGYGIDRSKHESHAAGDQAVLRNHYTVMKGAAIPIVVWDLCEASTTLRRWHPRSEAPTPSQISCLAAASTIPVTKAAKKEKSSNSLRILVIPCVRYTSISTTANLARSTADVIGIPPTVL